MQVPYVYVLNYVLYNARCRFVAITPRFPSHLQLEVLAEQSRVQLHPRIVVATQQVAHLYSASAVPALYSPAHVDSFIL